MNLLQRAIAKIKELWLRKDAIIKKSVPPAVKVVQGLDLALKGPVDEILVSAITFALGQPAGALAEKLRQGLIKFVPNCLFNLNMINAIANITDPEEQMHAILDQFKFSMDDQKKEAYHMLCVHLIQYLSDGKLSWGECVRLAEEGFDVYVKEYDGAIAA